ncbi:hypothetical protein CEUSTIGMA_g10848.t1 [Chlamydomonas eustigma]|uniref:Uncharacterized protein n=1 Tax=Chlamydomonas eustigma TaxID=1157962 RepID=A0A250XK64_9CHLO|nr:hypothetical protein CEUSTIGMA_g10848.t1 [Chlamydomonas eustigma]|eukprot:GAX83423.1 hypothetical protein CEUSTIGMA_g10848.t1 [Chlamydomonas eustigma]
MPKILATDCKVNAKVLTARPVVSTSVVTRRHLLGSAVWVGTIGVVNDEATASNKDDVIARKERLAKKKESVVKVAGPEEDKNISRTTSLLSSKERRLQALREKAERIRNGEDPTF